MVYYTLSNRLAILILNFLTNFFIFFGSVFLVIVNLIILESSLIYSNERQNRYILFYGILLFLGMLILVLLGEIFDNPSEAPFLGLKIRNGIPIWGLIFFSYIVIIMTIFTLIPINYTNFKIYSKFETKALKRKWFYYLVGFLGLTVVFYSFCVYNVLDPVRFSNIRSLISILSVSLIIWGYMMYHGIGIKLKSE